MATKIVRHSGIQREVLNLYAAFFRVFRTKPNPERKEMSKYLAAPLLPLLL